MLRLAVAGPDSILTASLCASCPHSAAGCCAGPPRVDWSDIARVVARGGRDWLLGEIAARRLAPTDGGLAIALRKGIARPPTGAERRWGRTDGPRVAKCVYHGPTGCTIPHDRRAATCNYYLCESAMRGEPGADAAREIQRDLARRFEAWDAALAERIASSWPDGPAFDAAFLDWLGAAFEELTSAAGAAAAAAERRP